ncbi:replication factor C subunit 4 [Octopus bimaculoides]|uniref:replication factor C subunit 4 n=1 Tax=Octopus bimaculoides TaxID=37653 RepID=UPI00071DF9EF|nr:replication factor C subunit 4 [Octopus bimaculoides]|eukprot:XP_014788076.1 PREDICTED: replication factor C subunit 4-like [Octopus bimaculoides]
MHAFLKPGSSGFIKKKEKPVSTETTKDSHIPWVEKYRPRQIDDVAYQDEVVNVLKKSLQGSDLPNLLFYGPPGTGKTSTILAAARELFGHDMYRSRVLELNSSDERGIEVIRNKVKKFAQISASAVRPDGKPCPPFKIIILDEADSMTLAAQTALRRTMEKESKTTRFCLICNYVSRIIDPITSRCAKFRFKPLTLEILLKRLQDICSKEQVVCKEDALQALIQVSEGDLRRAITLLQSVSRLKGEEQITKQDILEVAGIVPEDVIRNILDVCHSDSYDKLNLALKEIICNGHSGLQIVCQLHDLIMVSEELGDKQKCVIGEKMAVVDKCMIDGGDEYLQLLDLLNTIMNQICHERE